MRARTAEDPWLHLDFDPQTGNIVAKFLAAQNGYSEKGSKTVALLHLDRREALATGCQRTFKRITQRVRNTLGQAIASPNRLVDDLLETDDHGLLGWCFGGSGRNEPPFSHLRQQHPTVWRACTLAFLAN